MPEFIGKENGPGIDQKNSPTGSPESVKNATVDQLRILKELFKGSDKPMLNSADLASLNDRLSSVDMKSLSSNETNSLNNSIRELKGDTDAHRRVMMGNIIDKFDRGISA